MNHDLVERLARYKHTVPTTRERAEMVDVLREAADEIERLRQAIAAEREACAKVCDAIAEEDRPYAAQAVAARGAFMAVSKCAAAIRARRGIAK